MASPEISRGTTNTDSVAAAAPFFMAATRSRAQLHIQVMDQPLQFSAQVIRGFGNAHPTSAPHVIFEPTIGDICHTHRVDVHAPATVAPDVVVAAERFACDDTAQSGFFLRLADRRVAWSLALVDRPFRHDPALACGRCHEGDLDALVADPIRDHGSLLKYTRHRSS